MREFLTDNTDDGNFSQITQIITDEGNLSQISQMKGISY